MANELTPREGDKVPEILEERRTSEKVVTLLFFGTYLGVVAIYVLANGGASNLLRQPLWFFVMVFLFPFGLFGLFGDGGAGVIIPAYIIYCFVFGLALKFRKRWQTCLLWAILLLLLGLNIAGCSRLEEHAYTGL